jgi:hypothetical protein
MTCRPPPSRLVLVLLALICPGASPRLAAQSADAFVYGFDGPARVARIPGGPLVVPYFSTIGHAGTGTGAQGWAMSMTVESDPAGLAEITRITIDGTDAADLFSGGFKVTQVTTGEGNQGAIAAIVLSFTMPITLPVNATATVAALDVTVLAAGAGGRFTLRYLDGRRQSNNSPPVSNTLTQAGFSVTPQFADFTATTHSLVECCDAEVVVGFSAGRVSSSVPRVEDLGDSCLASAAALQFDIGSRAEVHVDVVSRLGGKGIQGWSLALELDGEAAIRAATADLPRVPGSPVPDELGFERTEVVDSAANRGRRGVTSAVVLSLDPAVTLPPRGRESVLRLVLDENPAGSQAAAKLRFRDGLVAAGQPVSNRVVVDGDSFPACNQELAALEVRFTPGRSFVRGNANGDLGVTVSDAVHTLEELFRGGEPAPCADAADANDDGRINVTDAIVTLAHLFTGGLPPAAPFPGCGQDVTEDVLGCPESPAICP